MRTRSAIRLVILFAVATATFIPAHAVMVRVILNRPGCTTPDAMVEFFNTDPDKFYKLHIEGSIANASPGPSATIPGGTPCVGSFAGDDLVLYPCPFWHGHSSCGTYSTNLPGAMGCQSAPGNQCNARNCDNIRSSTNCSSTCTPTCDNLSTEWCSTLVNFQVTVVATSTDGTNWTADGTVLCRKGSYGSSPACNEDSYCTTHTARAAACSFEDPELMCLNDEE